MDIKALNYIPIVGHMKGAIQIASGNPEEGHRTIRQASRSSIVAAGGVIGAVGGPLGSAAGGVVAGLAADFVITGDSGVPDGILADVADIVDSINDKDGNLINLQKPVANLVMSIYSDATGGIKAAENANPKTSYPKKATLSG